MRIMFDGTDPAKVPAGADLYAGYVDGQWPSAAGLAAKFPGAKIVRIAVFASTNDGDFLDVETGDATPAQAVDWVLMRRQAGHPAPGVYCNQSTLPAVQQAFGARSVPMPPIWLAKPGTAGIAPGTVATQWGYFGDYDSSSVVDYLPGIDPAPRVPDPAPAPPPPPPPPAAATALAEDVADLAKHPQDADLALFAAPVVAVVPTVSGGGYWLVASNGAIFPFGDADSFGPQLLPGQQLNRPIVAAARSAGGHGLILTAADGGIFTFGDAEFHGALPAIAQNAGVPG